LREEGDQALVHGLRGRPSNRRLDEDLRQEVVQAYRKSFADFGPTLASEKLAEQGLKVSAETLRHWLLAEGLWQRQRKRDIHRSRRPRRSCFGELVQMDASIHDWLEGRGEELVLLAMIDDATNRIEAGFYEGETVEAYMDLVERWLRRHGRPRALYTDRDSVFQWQSKGRAAEGTTQFGRAMEELGIELILAHSPQAKGRVERFFGLAQDRWVKELRLAQVTTRAQANDLVYRQLMRQYNRRFTVKAAKTGDAHRDLNQRLPLAAILCEQAQRLVANDYTIRFANRHYQLHKPALPGLRGGRVIVEERRDGKLKIRFGERYLDYHEIVTALQPRDEPLAESGVGASTPGSLRSPSVPAPTPLSAPRSSYRPPADHPWRRGFPKKPSARTADISILV
jgi:transposase-like protein